MRQAGEQAGSLVGPRRPIPGAGMVAREVVVLGAPLCSPGAPGCCKALAIPQLQVPSVSKAMMSEWQSI